MKGFTLSPHNSVIFIGDLSHTVYFIGTCVHGVFKKCIIKCWRLEIKYDTSEHLEQLLNMLKD